MYLQSALGLSIRIRQTRCMLRSLLQHGVAAIQFTHSTHARPFGQNADIWHNSLCEWHVPSRSYFILARPDPSRNCRLTYVDVYVGIYIKMVNTKTQEYCVFTPETGRFGESLKTPLNLRESMVLYGNTVRCHVITSKRNRLLKTSQKDNWC